MSEKEYLDKIENFLRHNNCKTWREVIPDDCEFWEKPYRVDLVFYRDDFGFIGVEAKEINTLGSGGIIAQAFEQLKNYREFTYFKGNRLNRWCMTFAISKMNQEFLNKNMVTLTFIKNFFKAYDISILEFIEYNNPLWTRITIDSLTKDVITIKEEEKEDGESISGI